MIIIKLYLQFVLRKILYFLYQIEFNPHKCCADISKIRLNYSNENFSFLKNLWICEVDSQCPKFEVLCNLHDATSSEMNSWNYSTMNYLNNHKLVWKFMRNQYEICCKLSASEWNTIHDLYDSVKDLLITFRCTFRSTKYKTLNN